MRQVGILTADLSPVLCDLVAGAGVAFLVIDAEQTGITAGNCAEVVRRLRHAPVEVAVRVPDCAARTLLEFANTGVHELVLPRLKSPDELADAVAATRYPPDGHRPRQVSLASGYGRQYSAVPRLTVLFETVEAVDAVDSFVRSPFFEGGWVGPTDLADDLDRHGRGSAELGRAVDAVATAVNKAGHSLGLPAGDLDGIRAGFAKGADRCAVYWERYLAVVLGQLASQRIA
ncbi:aldolase/citrate lyase family protein [Amycolatopsis jejuensis]|uniref:aldolase/citrate lyase family protein n=1 Tax=Amycolatopsis jejuensis TaxID=330084 RepID=UPI001B8055EB|nr:aldolase/citrate lyase family protein [Amycolatopsis jejuensis]